MSLSAAMRASIHDEVEELRRAILEGRDVPRRRRSPINAKPKAVARRTPPAPKPSYDREKIVQLYSQGLRVSEVAAKIGAHRTTVQRVLREAGIAGGRDKSGPARQETCQRGHSMEDALILKKGGRQCRACKRERDREAYRRAQQRKRDQAG